MRFSGIQHWIAVKKRRRGRLRGEPVTALFVLRVMKSPPYFGETS
jgi:hypothetical protein